MARANAGPGGGVTVAAAGAELRPEQASPRAHPSGWWGVVLLVATEATLFLLLVASYFYLRVQAHGSWPPPPLRDPSIPKPLLATAILVVSSGSLAMAVRSSRAVAVRGWLALTLLLGLAFLGVQGVLVRDSLDLFKPRDGAYGSIYYTLIGVHGVHVAAGALGLAWSLLRAGRGSTRGDLTLRVVSIYWHFVNVVAVVVFLTLYIAPRG